MEYSRDDLLEAKRQIDSTLHKLRETVKTLQAKEKPERYSPDHPGGAPVRRLRLRQFFFLGEGV